MNTSVFLAKLIGPVLPVAGLAVVPTHNVRTRRMLASRATMHASTASHLGAGALLTFFGYRPDNLPATGA